MIRFFYPQLHRFRWLTPHFEGNHNIFLSDTILLKTQKFKIFMNMPINITTISRGRGVFYFKKKLFFCVVFFFLGGGLTCNIECQGRQVEGKWIVKSFDFVNPILHFL